MLPPAVESYQTQSGLGVTVINGRQVASAAPKIVQPSKLAHIDSQRIIAILHQALDKLSLLSPIIAPSSQSAILITASSSNSSLLPPIDDYFSVKLKEQMAMMHSVDSIMGSVPEDRSRQLKENTRELLRYLMKNRSLVSNIMASSPETVEALDPVTEGWKNLIKSVFHKLRTTVEEDRVRDEQVQSVLQKKDRAQAEIEQLRAQLETARTQRQAELDQKNDTIEKLKDELKEFQAQTDELLGRITSRSVQRQEFDFGHHRLHAEKLQEELNGTRKQWLEMRQKNRDDEAAMRKKRSKIENELEAWITKYDTEMEEKQNEIDDLTVLYTEEKANLNELEARYSALSAEWAEIEKERAIKEEKRKREEAEFQRKNRAATLIQALFRGWVVRRGPRKKEAKKGKKKK